MIPKYPKGDAVILSDEFKSTDFDCQCFRPTCQVTQIDPELVKGLDALALVFPIITVHSAFRCAPHNKEVGGAPKSLHLTGQAADISTPFAGMTELRNAAEKIPCFANGGIAQYRNHIHVDTRGKKARWGESKQILKRGQVMAGQFGVEESKEVAETLAKGLNVASKMVHGEFFAALGFIAVLNGVKGIDFEVFKKEIGELDQAERDAIQAAFVNNLDLVNKDVQSKIVQGTNALQDAVDLVNEAVTLWNEGEALFNRLKAIVTGQPVPVKG